MEVLTKKDNYETVTIEVGNNNFITYKIVDGTAFGESTTEKVIQILNDAIKSNRIKKLRIFLGDTKTGRDWCEEWCVLGYIGRSSGTIKIPLLLKNQDSSGGYPVLDHCIIKITENKKVVYKHPKYYLGKLTISEIVDEERRKMGYKYDVLRDGNHQAFFKTKEQAENYILFLKGERNRI